MLCLSHLKPVLLTSGSTFQARLPGLQGHARIKNLDVYELVELIKQDFAALPYSEDCQLVIMRLLETDAQSVLCER